MSGSGKSSDQTYTACSCGGLGCEGSIEVDAVEVEVVHWIKSQPGRWGCHSRYLMGEWWIRMARVCVLGERVVMWTVVGVEAETEARK